MAPGAKVLEAELVKATDQLWFSADRETLSVNTVRSLVERKLKLEDGFFKQKDWKDRSKTIITSHVSQIQAAPLDAEEVSTQAQAEPQNGRKHPSQEDATPPRKRQKVVKAANRDDAEDAEVGKGSRVKAKKTKPGKSHSVTKKGTNKAKEKARKRKKASSEEEDSAADDSDLESPKRRASTAKSAKRKSGKNSYKEESTSEDDEDEGEVELEEIQALPVVSKPAERQSGASAKVKDKAAAKKKADSDGDSPLSELDDADFEQRKEQKAAAEDGMSSELSELEDHAPKPKAARKSASTGTGDEAEMKTLQKQLAKCGIRKIWGVELKSYGDDIAAKIRHLKGMLREAGIEGRFSTQKARKIKEQRELEADLAAVTEMNKAWGLGDGSGRPSRMRGKAEKKSYAEADEDDEDDIQEVGEPDNGQKPQKAKPGKSADDEEDSEADDATRARGRGSAKYRADLAFLGDESESD